ncbi:hypothetical protein GCM10027093_30880 [Paraburkholderia jirisanensis]
MIGFYTVHRQISNDQVVWAILQRIEQFDAASSARCDAHVRNLRDGRNHGMADDRMIVGDDDPQFAYRIIHEVRVADRIPPPQHGAWNGPNSIRRRSRLLATDDI